MYKSDDQLQILLNEPTAGPDWPGGQFDFSENIQGQIRIGAAAAPGTETAGTALHFADITLVV
jgi:hypothetical protein